MGPSSAATATAWPATTTTSSSTLPYSSTPSRASVYCFISPTPFMVDFPGYVNLAAATLSVVGATTIIVNHFFVQRSSQVLSRLVTALAIADLIGSLDVVVSQLFLIIAKQHYTPAWCFAFRAIFQYAFVSSFVWTTCIAVFLYRASHQKRSVPSHYVIMHLVAWILPLALVGVSLAIRSFEVDEAQLWCRQETWAHLFLWFIPLFMTIMANGILYVLIACAKNKRGAHKRGKQLSLFFGAFLMCWIWDIAHHTIQIFQPDCQIWPLLLLKAALSPLQGFLNMLVYGLSFRLFARKQRVHAAPPPAAPVRDFRLPSSTDSYDDLAPLLQQQQQQQPQQQHYLPSRLDASASSTHNDIVGGGGSAGGSVVASVQAFSGEFGNSPALIHSSFGSETGIIRAYSATPVRGAVATATAINNNDDSSASDSDRP